MISISETDSPFKNELCESVNDVPVNTTIYIRISLERRYENYFDKQNPDTLDKSTPNVEDGEKMENISNWDISDIIRRTESPSKLTVELSKLEI